MDRNEKGYFNKFMKMLGKGSTYITLFQILARMEQFDKEAFLKKAIKRGIPESNINTLLHHLYHHTLRSLRVFHEKNYYKIQINNLLAEAEVLLGKNLRVHALKLLDKAEKMAKTSQYYTALIEIQKIRIVQLVALSKTELLELVKTAYSEVEESINTLSEELKYRELNHLTLICYRNIRKKDNNKYAETLRLVSDHDFLTPQEEPISFYSKYYKENIKSTEARIYNDRKAAQLFYDNIIKIWQSHPEMIKAEPMLYLINLSNYLNNSLLLGNVDDFQNELKKIDDIPTRFLSDKIELFQMKVYLEQVYFYKYKKIDAAYFNMIKNSKEYKKNKNYMTPTQLITIQSNYLQFCFLKEKYNEGLDWILEILERKKTTFKQHIIPFCKTLQIIFHFELKNIRLLESLISSIEREQLKKGSPSIPHTECVVNFIKNLLKANSKKDVIFCSQQYLLALKVAEQNSPNIPVLEVLKIWGLSNLENKSMGEIFKEIEL